MNAYAALSAGYDALMSDGQYEKRAAFLDRQLRRCAAPVETVLDLGCGTGTIAWNLARRGYRVIAADSSEEMLTAAMEKAEAMENMKTGGQAGTVGKAGAAGKTRDGGKAGTAGKRMAAGKTPAVGKAGTAGKAGAVKKTGAVGKACPFTPPLFICQSMTDLRLGRPVDAAVSTLDSLNYLTRERDLRTALRRVGKYLRPGGLFLFDVNTPYKLRRMDGQVYMDEAVGLCCVWRTFYDRRTRICTYQVDLFYQRPDGAWERRFEEHRQRAWTAEQLTRYLTEAGFDQIRITGDLTTRPPLEEEDRWMILAKKRTEKPRFWRKA